MDHGLTCDRHICRRHQLAKLRPGHRAVGGNRRFDHGDATIGLSWRNPLLLKAFGVPSGELRCGEALQPPVVVRPNEMQGAAVEPGHQERPVVEPAVHISRSESLGPRPDGEACGAKVLRLHRQQPVDDLNDTARSRPQQKLGRQPPVVPLALNGP